MLHLHQHRPSIDTCSFLTCIVPSLWRHQMETFFASLAICAGNSPVTGEFPAQRPVTRIFEVFFDLRLNKRLSKQSWGWWFEMVSRPLWRHCNVHLPKGPHASYLPFTKNTQCRVQAMMREVTGSDRVRWHLNKGVGYQQCYSQVYRYRAQAQEFIVICVS